MHQKLLKSAHYIELGSYQYWPVLVPRGIRLYTYEQIPVSLKDNPYITDGYRAYLPSRLCIKRYSPAASVGRAGGSSSPQPFLSGVPAAFPAFCVPVISWLLHPFHPFLTPLPSRYLHSSLEGILDPEKNNDSK